MAQKEIDLLESVEMRFALADTDAKFTVQLSTFLAPILRKLDSTPQVQQKTMQVLAHINKRLKATPSIQVPLPSVLDLMTDPKAGQLTRNVAMIYLEMGFPRLPDEQAANLLPQLLQNLSERPSVQQQTLYSIALPLVAMYKEKRPAAFASPFMDPFGFTKKPQDVKLLLDKFADTLLYVVPSKKETKEMGANRMADGTPVPVGLSRAAVNFVTNATKSPWASHGGELKRIKVGIVKFAGSPTLVPEGLHDTERFKVLLLGSCDFDSEVAAAAEDALKRLKKPDFEADSVVSMLYSLYLGTTQTQLPVNSEHARDQGTVAVKTRVITYMLKSARSASTFPSLLQVMFDALYGEGAHIYKLRQLGMSFAQWVARMANDTVIQSVAPVVLSGLLKFINETAEEDGTQPVNQEMDGLRGSAYEAVGLVSKRAPELFQRDISILAQFFKAISVESRNVKVSVQEALSTMVEAYKPIGSLPADSQERQVLEQVLLSNVEKSEPQARFSAVRYANALFPFSYGVARFMNLLVSGDNKLEVKEEALRGLRFPDQPRNHNDEYAKQLPKFGNLVSLLLTNLTKRTLATSSPIKIPGMRYIGTYSVVTYSNALEFLRNVLILTADPTARMERLGAMQEETNQISDVATRTQIKALLANMSVQQGDTAPLQQYIQLIEHALKSDDADALLQSVASFCLVEVISLAPSSLSQSYAGRVDWILGFLSSIKVETRQAMAHLLGIVATSQLEQGQKLADMASLVNTLITTVNDTSKQTTVEARHGSALALAYVQSRLAYRYPQKYAGWFSKEVLPKWANAVSIQLDATSTIQVHGGCIALGQMGLYGSWDALFNASESDMQVDGSTPATTQADKVLDKLMSLTKTSKEPKIQEEASRALGFIALGNPQHTSKILDFFYTLPAILSKQVEINFTIGSGFCAASAGWKATCMEEHLDIADAPVPNISPPEGVFTGMIDKWLDDLIPGGRPVVKKAVCVWLLCLVKYCGQHPLIKASLARIHRAFSILVADRDDFVQEVASKGIGLVYELGDDALRKELVSSLVSTLTDGRRVNETITADTTIFDPTTLGTTPDGSTLTTYQSILSLASDMNQPDLVYKFMNLASHNAIWNSRRGASMGFGSIMAHAEQELLPFLPQIIPRLFRFQFDPNAKVADAMKSIWRSLVKDPKKAVEDHFVVIMRDLLKSMGDRQWRNREASCVAMTDLLHGINMNLLEPFLQEAWTMCFRALDDIKESVRNAALATCKGLTNTTLRYTETNKDGQRMLDALVPFLLTKGLGNMAEDVRKFSLSTLLKLCKKSGPQLKGHMAEIVLTLLESLSSLEPQVLNYLTFHVDKYNMTQEQLDTQRLSAAKMSPMMEAIESTIDNMDETVLAQLMPKLLSLARKAVGLPSKAGIARVFVSLVSRMPNEMKPHADAVLKTLTFTLNDRSAAVRKSNAVAVAHVVRLASEGAIKGLLDHLTKLYFEGVQSTPSHTSAGSATVSDEQEVRSIPAIVLSETVKYAPDVAKNLTDLIFPIAAFGSHDNNETIRDLFKGVCEALTGGLGTALKLHLPELVHLVKELLSSASWDVKRQVGKLVVQLSTLLQGEPKLLDTLDTLIPLLLEALSGRTWDGKEALVEGVVSLCKHGGGKHFFAQNKRYTVQAVMTIFVREVKKNNREYKRHTIRMLGEWAEAMYEQGVLTNSDLFDQVWEYFIEMATELGDASEGEAKDAMEVDDGRDKALDLAIRSAAFVALAHVVPPTQPQEPPPQLFKVFVDHLDGQVWLVRGAVLDGLLLLLKSRQAWLGLPHNTLSLVDALLKPLADGKYTTIREKAVDTLLRLTEGVSKQLDVPTKQSIKTKVEPLIESEPLPYLVDKLKQALGDVTGMPLS